MKKSPDSLDGTLRGWRVNPPSDPGFRHSVWQRINRRQRESWPAYIRSHAAAWALVAAVTVGAAAYTGSTLARVHVQADREALVVTYLVDLDPRVQAKLKPAGS